MSPKIFWFYFSSLILVSVWEVSGVAVKLDESNFDEAIGETELVMLNFYADWCRFSQMLSPIWDELALKASERFPADKVVIGKVDAERSTALATRFHISKYPTLKLLRHGQVVKKEYRGQRTADAIIEFVVDQLKDPIHTIQNITEIDEKKKTEKRILFGYFDANNQATQYANYQKLAKALKDDCKFVAGVGDVVAPLHPAGQPLLTFVGRGSDEDDTFLGDMNNYAEMLTWGTDRCIPLVREITFENAEELTEEGLPFLILFHAPGDQESPKAFRAVIERELKDEKANVNFLLADGQQFAHPLRHLGKDKDDLPLIAIDSFRHMYLFKDYKKMNEPGALKTFLADLYSGKLHREFHYGPSEDEAEASPNVETTEQRTEDVQRVTDPPESTFKKLGPSEHRYTLLEKQEL